MQMTIVLRQEVPDIETGNNIFTLIEQRLQNFTELKISGQISDILPLPIPEPEPG